MSTPIENRYEFSLFFDVKNGNPNGDPDAGNLPRIDPETSKGIVSDVCIKRKIRNYVDLVKGERIDDPAKDHGFKIYVQEAAVLNKRNELAYVPNDIKHQTKKLPKDEAQRLAVTKFMTDNFYDIRTFGAVMTTEVNCGQVRGPVQMCFAESVDPVLPLEMSITRMAVTNEKDIEKERTMGRKQYVPYGLYRLNGFISASLAEKTGFDDEDLQLLFEALMNMFESDRSAARGLMSSRKLIVFKHESKLGCASAHTLFDSVKVTRAIPDGQEARDYADYQITVGEMPEGVETQVFDYIAPSV